MNLNHDSFLCLDIGTYGVRGLAYIIQNAHRQKSAMHFVRSTNKLFALKSVIDELEQKLNTRFDSAFVTGDFGDLNFRIISNVIPWSNEHKISEFDLKHQLLKMENLDDYCAMHIIPMLYRSPKIQNIKNNPIGLIDTSLQSNFSVIYYKKNATNYISEIMRNAYIKPSKFFDPVFLQNELFRKESERVLFIDLGNSFTTISIWGNRGPLFFEKIKQGQRDITMAIAKELKINIDDADALKINISNAMSNEMDRFTPAGTSEKLSQFSRADVNEIFIPKLTELISLVYEHSRQHIEKYKPQKIILTGGGSEIKNIEPFIEKIFNLPLENQSETASIRALSEYIWNSQKPERDIYIQKRFKLKKRLSKLIKFFTIKKRKKTHQLIPILPSTLCFDMKEGSTYTMFASGGISMIHVDIMDGFYVNRVASSIEELKNIRKKTKAHLHVHLMTVDPVIWSQEAIEAGANTIIVSFNTNGIKKAIQIIKKSEKRCGIAINPDTKLKDIVPFLGSIDEVMVMAVNPGAAGQEFDQHVLQTIKSLSYTRKKHKLKYLISVDGGINPQTAKQCWDAGANLLISGSYLAKAPNFPLAVQSLLKH